MSDFSKKFTPTISIALPPSAVNTVHNATASNLHPTTSIPADNQNTLNIIFGVLAVVLALIAIGIGWLQLRSFRAQPSDEEVVLSPPQYELVEV